MQTDMFGAKCQKVNLHMHTMRSDGALSPATALGVHESRRPDSSLIADYDLCGDAAEIPAP